MKFGVHVSIAGGIFNAPLYAAEVGCETFQMFTRSPRGGAAPKLTTDIVDQFKQNCAACGYAEYYVHAPYYINLASAKKKTVHDSIRILREDLERSSALGVSALMAHLGSANELPRDKAIPQTIAALNEILHGYTGSTRFLIEIAAGAGTVVGDTFEEVGELLSGIKHKHVGVCFDTAHAFASGYDLRTSDDVAQTMQLFHQHIGIENLTLIHGNDSKVALGARVDRHQHIGHGHIGSKGFAALINFEPLRNINMILETPKEDEEGDDWDKVNLAVVKKIRKQST